MVMIKNFYSGTLDIHSRLVISSPEKQYLTEAILQGRWIFFSHMNKQKLQKIFLRHEDYSLAGHYDREYYIDIDHNSLIFHDAFMPPTNLQGITGLTNSLSCQMKADSMFYYLNGLGKHVISYKREQNTIISVCFEKG
jgi:hypothetical protein